MTKRAVVVITGILLALAALGTIALADDGGVMQRTMGHDAFTAMVQQMRGVLGNERADQMLASCEAMVAAAQSGTDAQGGMSGMMSGGQSGMSGMMSGTGMQGMMGR